MSGFTFVHAADLHLDTPFEGIGRVSSEVAVALREASLSSFDALIDLAISRNAAFVLISGDIYDGVDRDLRAQFRFLRGLERLSRENISVHIVHGNHDPLDGWSAISTWPTGVNIYSATDVSTACVERGRLRLATIYGMSYPTRDVAENLALRYQRGPDPGIHIGLLHCNVGGNGDHESYSPCSLDDLRAARMDYWALGHIHRRQILQTGSPWIVYSGNLQGRSSKPSELGEKGAYVVTVDQNSILPPEFVSLDHARFLRIELDIGLITDLPHLLATLQEKVDALRLEHQSRGLLVRATLIGRGPLHADLRRPGVLEEIRTQLREASAMFQPFVWWDDVRAQTQPDLDLNQLRSRGDFLAEIVRLGDDLLADPARLISFFSERTTLSQMGSLGLLAPSPYVERPQQEMLEEAITLALDLLDSRS